MCSSISGFPSLWLFPKVKAPWLTSFNEWSLVFSSPLGKIFWRSLGKFSELGCRGSLVCTLWHTSVKFERIRGTARSRNFQKALGGSDGGLFDLGEWVWPWLQCLLYYFTLSTF